jgi:hypothetical protein
MARHWKHRSISKVKKNDCSKKNQQVSLLEEVTKRQRPIRSLAAAGELVIDLARFDETNRTRACDGKDADQIKYPVIAKILSKCSGQNRSQKITAMIGNLIAADPSVEQTMANQAKT